MPQVSKQETVLLDRSAYLDLVRRALEEDIGAGDVTTEATVSASQRARGVLLVKADCTIAGLEVALEAFRQLDPTVHAIVNKRDGARCQPGEEIAEVVGAAR